MQPISICCTKRDEYKTNQYIKLSKPGEFREFQFLLLYMAC
jgi:hypothetical protein